MNVFRFLADKHGAAAALLIAIAAAPARGAGADDAERSSIARERAAIESRYSARQRECRDRFVVTSCIDDAKGERRRGLDALRVRQLQLDESRRRSRTEARRAELAAKAAEDARREQDRAARAASAPAPRETRPLEPRHEVAPATRSPASRAGRDHPISTGPRVGPASGKGESAAQRRENEARHRASFETRQQQAAQHRQEVLDKAAQRAKGRAAAAPLPTPASAPAR